MNLQIECDDIDFHQLVERSLNSFWILDGDCKILYCNNACLTLLKATSSSDILFKNMHEFVPHELHATCKERLLTVLEKQEESMELAEAKMIRKDGVIIDVEVRIAPYYLKDKVYAQVVIQDITHKKTAEKLLNDREKLASLGQIAAGIAHEVKNPLTSVKGFLQLMKESNPHPYIYTIESELKKALDTLENLLHVSKPDLHEEPTVPIYLSNELYSIVNLFQDKLYNVEIEMDISDSNKKIMGKRNLFLKALFNLIKNAFEAIPDKGKIKVEHYYQDGVICIKICDTGVGIPHDKLKLLGTPFFTSKSEGTGLGLTQVFTTIHEHGGRISVQSTIGKGTVFHLQLPSYSGE
ncbi:nitrogen regulation protein NR(II) [Bacillus sp. V5-8f]|uniref:two-component system sensor histidine kinase NtrB n=1 Tax=Bacillus sp. V5-8f TaxID=2053044 RepID=UPI000C7752E4|nr:ATP-binding protein [Bacillus sp. V5-8f]PLT35116.1 PAS domain-containing sensor histidine kinase [Bacillus sp. V5-8f]